MRRTASRLLLALGLAAASLTIAPACARTQAPAAAAPAPKPRNAATLATEISGAKLTSMIRIDRLRGHALAPKLSELEDVQVLLEGTGIEPVRDFERVFVASSGVNHDDAAVIVGEHGLPDEKLKAAIDVLVARSAPAGEWTKLGTIPAARVTVRGRKQVIGVVAPSFVVVLPDALAPQLPRFEGTGGFPEESSTEAVITQVQEPSMTLRWPHAPAIPGTIRSARIGVRLGADGGADIAVDAQSEGADQARADAAALTEAVERATTVKVAFVRVRFIDPIAFEPEGDRVKAGVHLTQGQLEMLMRFAGRPHRQR